MRSEYAIAKPTEAVLILRACILLTLIQSISAAAAVTVQGGTPQQARRGGSGQYTVPPTLHLVPPSMFAILSQDRTIRAVTTLRSYLEDRYRSINRVVKPIWFANWLVCIALIQTPLHWWPFYTGGTILCVTCAVTALIKCPRCENPLGFFSQLQEGGRRRQGKPLQWIWCPHCKLGLDEPIT
jgi:hypothetical protein